MAGFGHRGWFTNALLTVTTAIALSVATVAATSVPAAADGPNGDDAVVAAENLDTTALGLPDVSEPVAAIQSPDISQLVASALASAREADGAAPSFDPALVLAEASDGPAASAAAATDPVGEVRDLIQQLLNRAGNVLSADQRAGLRLILDALTGLATCLVPIVIGVGLGALRTLILSALSVFGGPVVAFLAIVSAIITAGAVILAAIKVAACALLPAAPTNMRFVGPECPATFLLRFTDNAINESGFHVTDSITGFEEDYPLHPGKGDVTLHVTGLGHLAGSHHMFSVYAFNDFGHSTSSNEVFASAVCP